MITQIIDPTRTNGPCVEGTSTPKGQITRPNWLVPYRHDGDLDLLDRLIEHGASNGVLRVFRYYGRCFYKYKHGKPYIWERQSTVAKLAGVSQNTVSLANDKLAALGMLAQTVEVINGKPRTVTWFLWLLDSSRFSQAQTDRNFDANPDRNFEANDLKRICLKDKSKTTTDGGMSLSFVQQGEEEGTPADVDLEPIADALVEPSNSGPIPAPIEVQSVPLPIELVEQLEAATDRPAVRSKLKAEAEAWLARDVEPLWIKLAILEYAAKLRLKDDPKPITVDVAWFRGVLGTWVDKGQATPVLARAALVAEQKLARQRETDRLALQAKRAREAETRASTDRDAALKSRWEGLTEQEREAIRAKVRADNPALARLKPMIEALCLAEVERRCQP